MSPALVFDFDGTILDTETSVFASWEAAYVAADVEPIPLDTWLLHIGKADGHGLDVRAQLCEQLGVAELPGSIDAHRRSIRDEMLFAEPIRPGVIEWIDHAVDSGVPLAIASSSPTHWVRPHLERIGLDSRFPVVCCADPGTPGKPDPTVYLMACEGLGVDPARAVAIEDSTHGVSAAIAAGMRCVAAPGPITRTMNFDHATIRTDSLAELNPAHWLV